ncbi:PLP-dependent aminotransferase family protein [Paenibacillus thailandensis]|uniref:PLP-dependent aminotransferase family protein n=1 Tax=Paenibacillus thailandensis TaxID=393250 RepID=A0ABW5QRV4_9BACL
MWEIELQRQSEISLKRQIYAALRDKILNGKLPAGEALPSTRQLAMALNVSRNTINEAYDMLIAEGYIHSSQGAPSRIADGLQLSPKPNGGMNETDEPAASFLADFRTGQPDLRQFPRYSWQQIAQKKMRDMTADQFGYTGPQGMSELREEISAWLYRSKALAVHPRDIFITAGATHALHVVADLMFQDARELLVEDPCNIHMLQTFINKGYAVRGIPVDREGLRTELLDGRPGSLVYVTPSHQFPLGGILPAFRRAGLIRFARENGSYIVEDDYDSEFRYYGAPVSPLYAMDPERVIYVGTFSKVLFPGLRIGYVVLPAELHNRWRRLRTYTDVQNPPFEQAALAEFLRTRKFDKHIGKMRKVYRERREALLSALKEYFGTGWQPWGDAAGLHLAVDFQDMVFDEPWMKASRQHKIRVTPVDYHCIRKGAHPHKLLFGYGHLEPGEICKGMEVLHQFFEKGL